MSHRVYTTEGVVLGGNNFGEANRWYFILTPDLGLIRARAQSVRALGSKLRGHLPLFGHLELATVRGRDGWHLTGAVATGRYEGVAANGAKRALMARVSALLRRFLPEAEGHAALFEEVDWALGLLAKAELAPEELEAAEVVLVWRLLHALGYIAGPLRLGPEGAPPPLGPLVRDINQALAHSHL